jgi:hypothetical protein
MSKRWLDALAVRVASLGHCPVCNDRGWDGTALRFNGGKGHSDDRDAQGCPACGKLREVVTIVFHADNGGPPPVLPGAHAFRKAESPP